MRRKRIITTICLCAILSLPGLAGLTSYATDLPAAEEDAIEDVHEETGPSLWAVSFVESARQQGLLPDDFSGDWQQPVTRLDFCRLVAALFEPCHGEAFPDCDNEAVISCAALGIISGFDDGFFHPEMLLTRQQAAVILRNAAQCLGIDGEVPVYIDPTADALLTSAWASEAVWWVMNQGIMAGTGSGCFNPQGTFTREQSVVTLMNLTSPAASEKKPDRVIETDNDLIQVHQTVTGNLFQRCYDFDDGTRGTMGRLTGKSENTVLFTAFVDEKAVIRMTDGSDWTVSTIAAGRYEGQVMYVYDNDSSFMFILPQQYGLRENNCLEYIPGRDGYLEVFRAGDVYCLRLVSRALNSGTVCDYTVIGSPSQIFDWNSPGPVMFMKAHSLHGDGRWCWDGYYYICPSTYVPSGENVYYRNTSCYFGNSMSAGLGYYRGCELLCLMIDDTTMLQQNSEGFLPQCNESTWLSGDYAIGAGYYDTRFNSDRMESWIRLYNYNHASNVAEHLKKYMDFYMNHAINHHQETVSGGWFVDDYYYPAGGDRTHTSLNHQLAEASVLYKAELVLDDSSLTELADKMILAVEDTYLSWMKDDHNLHYSISATGKYGGNDYPYLTYNDLYNMQVLLNALKGSPSPQLQSLMDSKLIWMRRNGVHGYKGETK